LAPSKGVIFEELRLSASGAASAGVDLDTEAFITELDSGEYRGKIDALIVEAIQRQVRAVLTIFIDRRRIRENQGKLILDTIEFQTAPAGDVR
jgi:hypothetical protein